jgi:hypothetical protein
MRKIREIAGNEKNLPSKLPAGRGNLEAASLLFLPNLNIKID